MPNNKVVIPGKVDRLHSKRFKIRKEKGHEVDAHIEIEEDGEYEVQKLNMDELPTHMHDGAPIRWFTHFAIHKKGQYINQKYTLTIPGLGSCKVVIYDSNSSKSGP